MAGNTDNDYRERVFRIVRSIPRGRVMTYGQIAEILGEGYTPRTSNNECWKPRESVLMNGAVVICKSTSGFRLRLKANAKREQRKPRYSKTESSSQRKRHEQRPPRSKSALCS